MPANALSYVADLFFWGSVIAVLGAVYWPLYRASKTSRQMKAKYAAFHQVIAAHTRELNQLNEKVHEHRKKLDHFLHLINDGKFFQKDIASTAYQMADSAYSEYHTAITEYAGEMATSILEHGVFRSSDSMPGFPSFQEEIHQRLLSIAQTKGMILDKIMITIPAQGEY